MDDIIIFSKTPTEHIERLRKVFEYLAEAGPKLKPSMCDSLSYLDHIVSEDGIETDLKKVEAIDKWPVPETLTDVRTFLGFTNHY